MTPVLLPGNMCDWRLWTDELRDVLPGPIDADLSLDNSIASMAERTLAANEGVVLPVGFSMGAIVAMEMWVQAPERIAGLVLLGYNATADLPERAAHRPRQQEEALGGGLERVLVEELKPNYLAARHRRNLSLLELLRDMGMSLGADVFVRQSEALRLRDDRVAVLPQIAVPIFYGCGADDALCAPTLHRRWQELTPDAAFEKFEGAGHMLPLEAPDVLASSISNWLATKGPNV